MRLDTASEAVKVNDQLTCFERGEYQDSRCYSGEKHEHISRSNNGDFQKLNC
jgi:hypothetical protein